MRVTAASILAADDLPIKTMAVPEWGGDVSYRALSIEELRQWEDAINDGGIPQPDKMMAHMLALSLCDEKGQALFKPEDAKALMGKNGQTVKALYEACCALNGLGNVGRKIAQGNSTSPASDSE